MSMRLLKPQSSTDWEDWPALAEPSATALAGSRGVNMSYFNRVIRFVIVIVLATACTTTKTERELHKCFTQCAKAHEQNSLPLAQCNDLCAEQAKPTPTLPTEKTDEA
jgi:hypothetical protein